MERTGLLSIGTDAAGRVTGLTGPALTPSEIRRRFIGVVNGPDRGARQPRGDHDLDSGHDLNSGHDLVTSVQLRAAAVLVPLVDRPEGMSVLLTRRTEHLSRHAGQIAFPGGRVEDDDADAVAAALRETEEEIGLSRSHVEPIGQLDRYVTGTGFTVTPVVAFVRPPFELALDPNEVADAFEVPLAFILNPINRHRQTLEVQGITRHFYVFPYPGRRIWGATAGMLVNLAELLTA